MLGGCIALLIFLIWGKSRIFGVILLVKSIIGSLRRRLNVQSNGLCEAARLTTSHPMDAADC